MFTIGRQPEEETFAKAVETFCQRQLGDDVHQRQSVRYSSELWRSFAEIGLLEMVAEGGEGAMRFASVALDVLGYYGFPGPTPHSIAGISCFPAERSELASGAKVATFGEPGIVAWAAIADRIACIEEGALYEGVFKGETATLGQCSAGRVERSRSINGQVSRIVAIFDMSMSAYVCGAGRFLVRVAADHAATRQQFKKPLGQFQAIAFPLADALSGLDAARLMTDAAAAAIDQSQSHAATLAASARLSANRAALGAAFAAHQTFGAYGMLTDGPVAWLSRQIQEYSTLGPSIRTLQKGLNAPVAAACIDRELWMEDEG